MINISANNSIVHFLNATKINGSFNASLLPGAQVAEAAKKGFFDNMLFGVHIGVWFLLFGTIIVIMGIVLFFLRERLKEYYYKWRWPERVIKICIHYSPSRFYKTFWRLIPPRGQFEIRGQIYRYDADKVIKEEDYLAEERGEDYFIKANGKEYKIDLNKVIGKKGGWPELHYPYNCPEAFDYATYKTDGFNISGSKINDLVKSDLWEKALNLSGQNALIAVCIVLGVINLFLSILIVSKVMGVLK